MSEPKAHRHLVRAAYEFVQVVRQEATLQTQLKTLADIVTFARSRGIELTEPALREALRRDWLLRRLALVPHRRQRDHA